MNRRIIGMLLIVLFLIVGVISVAAVNEHTLFFETGKTLRDYLNNTAVLSDRENETNIAAVYHDKTITWSIVEHNRAARMLYAEEGTEPWSDREVIDSIVEGMIMVEEAERLGVSATQAEIDSMVEGTKLNYEIPEVKKLLDDYCAGADISIEEYFELIRENAPAIISKQKLRDEIGRQYCEDNGLEFTKINPPQEMMDAIDAYIEELFQSHKDEITYYIDTDA